MDANTVVNTANTTVQQDRNALIIQSASLIKPKYLKEKSVFYKTSGYLKDLLGEK